MTQGNRPIEHHNRSLVMDDEFEGEDEYEIIDTEDLEGEMEIMSTDESEASDSESERKMSCVPTTDHASLVFTKHIGSVFCIGINPQNENIVITGGQDDKVIIWNTQTGEVILESVDFTDSVSHALFNHDGKYVSAVDMSGRLKVWKTTTQPYQEVWDTKIGDVQWMKWHPQGNILLVGESTGSVYMWKIPSAECKVLPGHKDLTDVGSFMPDGKRAVVCYVDGSIRVFNLANSTVAVKYESPEVSLDTVISLDVHPDNNLVAVGCLSSRLCIIKTQGSKSLDEHACIEERDRGGEAISTSVECVAFGRKVPYNLILAATDNAVHVYDYVKNEARGYIPIEEGVTRLVWPEGSNTAFIGTKVGKVAVCDIRSLRRIATFEGHSKSILEISVTKDGKTLITASDDETVRIFHVEDLISQIGTSSD